MTVLFVCSYTSISGGIIMIFEHAYRLKLKGFQVSITFKYSEEGFDLSVFPHSEDVSIIEYGSKTEFDFVIATFWLTVYDLSDFKAKYYVYFGQSDERLFYHENDLNRFWVEQTYGIHSLPVLTSALFLAEKLSKEFASSCYHVPNGLDLTLFNSLAREKRDRTRILIEGPGKIWFKRVDEAFRITKTFKDIEVWYVTPDGYVASNWKADKIFKKVSHHQMPDIYRNCDILLKLSDVESFGLPNLEMMACGGAVITTNFTGQEEYAVNGVNCIVVNIGDFDSAKDRLSELIRDSDLRHNFGENGKKTAEDRNWATLTPDFANRLNLLMVESPDGNAHSTLPRLTQLSNGYRKIVEEESRMAYLNKWKESIQVREHHLIYRIANRLYKLLD